MAVCRARRGTRPLAEDAVLVAAAGGGAAAVLDGGARRRLPAPRLLHPELAAPRSRAPAARRGARAPLAPGAPLAVDAALGLALAVDHRTDLLPVPGRAEAPAAARHRLDLSRAPLEAHAAHVGGRHATGPALPLAPLAVHGGGAAVQAAAPGLLQRARAPLGAEGGRLRDRARPLRVAVSARHRTAAPRAPLRELANRRRRIGAGHLVAGFVLQQRALALQAVASGVRLDAA
mmetsp:Transcript_15514/g.46483  ORF Transcript_15514/g.46483 Transcript_15514/m.46483 type:complete len:233 (-) Transcript_15514:1484-2182(-)